MKKDLGVEPLLLSELLSTFPEHRFMIDMKNGGAASLVARSVKDAHAEDRVSIGSFRHDHTKAALEMIGKPRDICNRVGVLGYGALALLQIGHPLGRRYLEQSGATDLEMHHRLLTKTIVEQAHEAGVHVVVWPPNTEETINRAYDIGSEAVMSDDIKLLKEVLLEKSPANKSVNFNSD